MNRWFLIAHFHIHCKVTHVGRILTPKLSANVAQVQILWEIKQRVLTLWPGPGMDSSVHMACS